MNTEARRYHRVSEQQRAQILAMVANGSTDADIAVELNMSKSNVGNIRRAGRKDTAMVVPDIAVIAVTDAEMQEMGRQRENTFTAHEIRMDSLKARVLHEVAMHGPFDDVRSLRDLVRRDPTDGTRVMDVTAALYSLNKQGLVKFRQHRGNTSSDELTNIKITGSGYEAAGVPVPSKDREAHGHRNAGTNRTGGAIGTDWTNPAAHGTVAKGGPVEHIQSSPAIEAIDTRLNGAERAPSAEAEATPEGALSTPRTTPEPSDADAWPLLQVLKARQSEAIGATKKAEAFMRAAEALAEADNAEAQRLLDRALALDGQFALSPIEQEYIRFAEAHS